LKKLLPFGRWDLRQPALEDLVLGSQPHDEEITKTRKSENTKQGDVVQDSIALAIVRRSFRCFVLS
jgi:hypothetical protein